MAFLLLLLFSLRPNIDAFNRFSHGQPQPAAAVAPIQPPRPRVELAVRVKALQWLTNGQKALKNREYNSAIAWFERIIQMRRIGRLEPDDFEADYWSAQAHLGLAVSDDSAVVRKNQLLAIAELERASVGRDERLAKSAQEQLQHLRAVH